MSEPDFILVFPGYFVDEMMFRYVLFSRNNNPIVKEFPVQTTSLSTMALAAIMDCVHRLPERVELEVRTKSHYLKKLFDERDYDLCKEKADKKHLFNILWNISWKSLKVEAKMLNKDDSVCADGSIVTQRNMPDWTDSIERTDSEHYYNV